MRGPRVKRGVPRPIAPHEAVALAELVSEEADEPWIAARNWAVLLLLYGAGLRLGVVHGARRIDVPVPITTRVVAAPAK